MCGCVESMDEYTAPHQLTPLNWKHRIQFTKKRTYWNTFKNSSSVE